MKQTLSKFESESVRTHSRRAAIAAAAGNVLEGYDIGIYGYSAVILAKLFFSDNGTGALILTFAVFASGYLTKPLGAVLFGHIGDRYGRRLALVTSVLLIGICTVLIGVLPTQASIGISAPILLTILRLLQGIAAGGESSGSAIFMVESAPPAHRGLYGSWQQVSTAGGLLLSSGAIGVLSAVFTQEEIFVWAWRIPFLLAIFTTLGALWLRLGVEETPTFEALEKSDAVVHNPLMVSIKKFWREIVVTIGVATIGSVGYYIFLMYMPSYLIAVIHVDPNTARWSNVTAIVAFAALTPIFGGLSDRVGRKPLLLGSCIGFVLLSFPAMYLITQGSTALIYIGQLIPAALLAIYSGAVMTAFVELFRTEVRYTAMAVGYNISVLRARTDGHGRTDDCSAAGDPADSDGDLPARRHHATAG